MQSKATTVDAYLASLPPDRRQALAAVRKVVLANLDESYEEGMQYGAIGYFVPHSVFPAGYHCDPKQPLPFAGLASQKNHMSLGLMSIYGSTDEASWFRAAWAKSGKKLDMGKCCIRFRKLEDLPLDVICEAIKRVPAKRYIEQYQASLEKTAVARKPQPATSASHAKRKPGSGPRVKAGSRTAARSRG